MAESALEKAVIKLTCQLFNVEEDRDRWIIKASSLDNQLMHSKASLANKSKDNLEQNQRLKALQKQMQQLQSTNVDMDYRLRTIALSASATKASLKSEGKESELVDSVLQALQDVVKKNGGGVMRLHSAQGPGSDPHPSRRPAGYWDDSSSESS